MSESGAALPLFVRCTEEGARAHAEALSKRLQRPLQVSVDQRHEPAGQLLLEVGLRELSLRASGRGAPGALRVDFEGGATAHRRRFGGGKGQLIARAVGLDRVASLRIFDGTAGLGGDAFVLASLGAELWLFERSPVVAALLRSGLERAGMSEDSALCTIVKRMRLYEQDLVSALTLSSPVERALIPAPEIIYLDPMFPERKKKAKVKKEMSLLQQLLGDAGRAGEELLLATALEHATHRVVVKRPRLAPPLTGPEPALQLRGSRCRFDIYPLRTIRSTQRASEER